MDYRSLKPMPTKAILKISEKDRADIFTKTIIKDDGTTGKLYITVDEEKGFDRKAEIFVQIAEVISVGRKVRNFQPGDTAIIDCLVDNDENCIIGWEGKDKYIALDAISTYTYSELWAYSDRMQRRPQDVRVFKKDALLKPSQILGAVRDGQLIANDPYVFIQHRTEGKKVTESSIIYKDTSKYTETEVLAVSQYSKEKYGIEENKHCFVKFADIFDVKLDAGVICACNDEDILLQ